MKSVARYLMKMAAAGALCVFAAVPAMAQRGGGGHSGGGGGHFGGGGFGGGSHAGGFSAPRSAPAMAAPRSGGIRSGGFRGAAGAPRTGFRGTPGAVRGTGAYRGSVRAGSGGAVGARQYVRGNNGAAIYGHGGNYGRYGWGSHYGWFYHGGFYGSLYYPWIGFGFWALPYGCYPFYWGDYQYYYGDGFFYQYDGSQYTVVEPPVGAQVTELPSDAKPITINGQQYYEDKGVYYQAVTKDDGTTVYQVMGKDGVLNTGETGVASVTPRVGDLVQQLPADCRKIHLNGNTYYVSEDGIYYQETRDANGNTAYKIVSIDSGDQDNSQ